MTDEYTPSTDQVIYTVTTEGVSMTHDSFYRWLAAHDAEVRAEAEIERYGTTIEALARKADRAERAEAEHDALAAQLDKVHGLLLAPFPGNRVPAGSHIGPYEWVVAAEEARAVIDADPSSLLAERDARIVSETITEFEDLYFGPGAQTRTWVANTMRERHGLPPRDRKEGASNE